MQFINSEYCFFFFFFFYHLCIVNQNMNILQITCFIQIHTVGKQTHDLTVIASDSKTMQSGDDNRKKFPLGAALQAPQNFPFALL